jgi:hypothetical protein
VTWTLSCLPGPRSSVARGSGADYAVDRSPLGLGGEPVLLGERLPEAVDAPIGAVSGRRVYVTAVVMLGTLSAWLATSVPRRALRRWAAWWRGGFARIGRWAFFPARLPLSVDDLARSARRPPPCRSRLSFTRGGAPYPHVENGGAVISTNAAPGALQG